ncbi:MAG: hypothetical protein [Caudoviricetes sp.]|nr:MAG: hypothetical protein [Caudoviricetes sp.]
MKLTFNRVRYQNLMSVGQAAVDIELDSVKKTLITGKNGGGKSTMLEALCFGLFGTPFRKIKKGQLVNTQNKKKLLVELWFTFGKDKYHVKRGIKPNVFSVTKNDVEWDESSSTKDFQSRLEEQLGVSPVAFKQIVVLGTAGYTPFMELTTPKRRELIEELLEVAVLGNMANLNKSEMKSTIQEMNLIENKIESLRREIDAHQTYIEKQKESEDSHVDDLKEEFDKHLKAVMEYRDQIAVLEAEMLSISEKIDTSLNSKINTYTTNIDRLKNALTDRQDMLESFKSGKCPTCNQAFADHDKIQATEHNIADIIEKKNELQKRLDETNEKKIEYTQLNEQLTLVRTKFNDLKSKMSVHVESARALKQKISSVETSVEIDFTKVDALRAEMNTCKAEKTELFDLKYTQTLVSDLLKDSGIKATVVKRYIPVFNKKINQYLKTMGADYTFTIDEEFNEVIKSRGREDFSYESFSQGERARIDLSLLFTWRDISSLVSGMEVNLLILDEIFDGASDADGVKSITRIIDSLNSNVFIISHREEHDKEAFGRWIQMVKKGRFSVMEMKHVQQS